MSRPWTWPTMIALGLAAAMSLLLLALGAVVPVYGSESVMTTIGPDGSATTTSSSGSATLVAVNGLSALLLVAVPLLVTVLVAVLLRRGSGRVAYATAWVLTLAYGGLCVLALLSIGLSLAPVALALLVACATARIDLSPVPAPA